MSNFKHIDLIIAGAGPAGLSTAFHLLQQDPAWADRMILLEKETHPRQKLCGGGVTRPGLQILQDLDFSLPLPIPQSRVDNIYLKYRNRTIHVRGEPMFVVFDRPELDHYLAQQAKQRGITIHENEAVQSYSSERDHVLVQSSKGHYHAKLIVGADGTTGVVSQTIKGNRSPTRISRTVEVLSPAKLDSPHFMKQSALFDFNFLSKDLQGYYWEFPSKVKGNPVHNRGVYDSRLVPSRSRANLPEIFEFATKSTDLEGVSPSFKGAPIHWFDPSNRISTWRAILVGDAAGVEVLFGEGISVAFMYGKIAAHAINKAFKDGDFRFRAYHHSIMRSKLGRYLFIRRLLASYLYHLGHMSLFPHLLWTAGQIMAKIWHGRGLY